MPKPTTEDYLRVLDQAKRDKKTVDLDFSTLPPEVDAARIRQQLSFGLPEEIASSLTSANGVTLDYGRLVFGKVTPPETPFLAKLPTMGLGMPAEATGVTTP